MANSALGTPTFQALAGNIKNQDGSPAIYSAGAWTFENSSGTTTFSVSDAGAVTIGQQTPGAVDITNTIRGYYLDLDNRKTAAAQVYVRLKAGGSQIGAIGATATNCFELWNAADNAKNAECSNAGAWTFPVSVSVTGTADVSGTSAALRTDGGCYVAKIMSAGTVTDRTPFPEDLQTAIDAVNSMEKLPEGEYDSANKEKQLDHSKLHPYISSGDYRDMSATVSCLALVCQDLMRRLDSAEERIRLLEGN